MNGLEIDPYSQQFKWKMLNLSTYPATLIHETLEVVGSVYKKWRMTEISLETRHASSTSWSSYNML